MRGLRIFAGPSVYWLATFAVAAGLMAAGWSLLGLGYLALAVTIGLFSELEERMHSLVSSSFSAVGVTSLVVAGSFILWLSRFGTGWYSLLLGKVEALIATMPTWSETVKIEAKDILAQMPSAVVILLVLGLFFALLFQRRMMMILGMRRGHIYQLTKFQVPDAFIWVFLAALAGTFLKVETQWLATVSANFLNVSIMVFFLQGLAVVGQYFISFRVNPFWQMVLTVILVSQLFLLVGIIGLADYWLHLRERLAKRTEQIDRNI